MPRPEVFLSHASADKESVKAIALQLQKHSIQIWLDEWNLVPGEPWVDALGQALRECSGCLVFLGPGGAVVPVQAPTAPDGGVATSGP